MKRMGKKYGERKKLRYERGKANEEEGEGLRDEINYFLLHFNGHLLYFMLDRLFRPADSLA
jgi:hypothetical protein